MSARRQIIAALSEDSHGGIATLHDVDRAETLVTAHRAEVLAEGAALLRRQSDARTGRTAHNSGLIAGAVLLDRAADRPAQHGGPDFFQPGRTYSSNGWLFRVVGFDTHPVSGSIHAVGWACDGRTDRWKAESLTVFDWEYSAWVDVTSEVARG
ncbi:hypothetical protein G9272_32320 [Streptomyces asoensis]|uniref:Uncharacterized protein n=1 Tax=Streptomyces asoensis TaxID=249586 RepID=A0A6M4WV46_9ACTN|nr:hypothetical protein [Streptomyces asoensis]QJT04404.1 hypothetical protein G9272_32320 [Streptomyces asoensis]